jgi:oxygen-independent coproporphyrinogen-3 oxidase
MAGFEHYEVSSFAREGCRSRHNFVYWTGMPYAAFGPGAHAFFPPRRRWNLRSWSAYREALKAGRPPLQGEEILSAETTDLERVWLGLRTRGGYSFPGTNPRQVSLVQGWAEAGLADVRGTVVRLTPRGWLLLDRLAVELHAAATEGAHAANA